MFRATIRADEETDVDAAVADLRARCERVGLAAPTAEMIAEQVRAVLGQLVERGQQIASVGSQMHVARELAGDGYLVRLVFRVGDRRTVLQRLIDGLRGR